MVVRAGRGGRATPHPLTVRRQPDDGTIDDTVEDDRGRSGRPVRRPAVAV